MIPNQCSLPLCSKILIRVFKIAICPSSKPRAEKKWFLALGIRCFVVWWSNVHVFLFFLLILNQKNVMIMIQNKTDELNGMQ